MKSRQNKSQISNLPITPSESTVSYTNFALILGDKAVSITQSKIKHILSSLDKAKNFEKVDPINSFIIGFIVFSSSSFVSFLIAILTYKSTIDTLSSYDVILWVGLCSSVVILIISALAKFAYSYFKKHTFTSNIDEAINLLNEINGKIET